MLYGKHEVVKPSENGFSDVIFVGVNKVEPMVDGLENLLRDAETQKDEAFKKYNELFAEVERIKRQIEIRKFGKEPSCKDCRYNVCLEFSLDGWHNLCGNVNAPCTCCNNKCDWFTPDNVYTKYMKEHNIQKVSVDKIDAIKTLFGDVFSDKVSKNSELMSFLHCCTEYGWLGAKKSDMEK